MSAILTLNSGSSTIKFSVFNVIGKKTARIYFGVVDNVIIKPHIKIKADDGATIFEEDLSQHAKRQNAKNAYDYAVSELLNWLKNNNVNIIAAGHRVAHGGTKYRNSVVFDADVVTYLESLNPLAPLHQPYNIEGYKILKNIFPQLLQVACFDTSFHTTCNMLSQMYALPKHLTEKGVRRYGFHGLSYEYIVSQFPNYLPKDKMNGKIIIAHLGQGASMCAVSNKKSVTTTLGFSALDGLPMGTRCGNLDPGVLLFLMDHLKMDYAAIEKLLYKKSGLLGVSGISGDVRVLLESNSEDAKLALDLFAYKTGAWLGMLTAELQGLDAIIFTAGIGENAAPVRAQICEHAAWLGVKIDPEKNAQNASLISTPDSKILVYIIPTNEEAIIARDTFNYKFSE